VRQLSIFCLCVKLLAVHRIHTTEETVGCHVNRAPFHIQTQIMPAWQIGRKPPLFPSISLVRGSSCSDAASRWFVIYRALDYYTIISIVTRVAILSGLPSTSRTIYVPPRSALAGLGHRWAERYREIEVCSCDCVIAPRTMVLRAI